MEVWCVNKFCSLNWEEKFKQKENIREILVFIVSLYLLLAFITFKYFKGYRKFVAGNVKIGYHKEQKIYG
jgi:hypothetical protein